jgi:PhnB protein
MNKNYKPKGYNSVSPYFILNGAQTFIEWMEDVFNAKEMRRYSHADGTIMHSEIQIDDSIIMVGDSSQKFPAIRLVMHVYVPNVDKIFQKAIKSGCEVFEEPKESEGDPDRRATFIDYWGNMWSVGTQK